MQVLLTPVNGLTKNLKLLKLFHISEITIKWICI